MQHPNKGLRDEVERECVLARTLFFLNSTFLASSTPTRSTYDTALIYDSRTVQPPKVRYNKVEQKVQPKKPRVNELLLYLI